ncbi:MAG: hypothetical protein IVW54_10335 [Candidatus Binataceae bacterium]|nr:hypothetical protein [Candidatus Binataceae bacterium]
MKSSSWSLLGILVLTGFISTVASAQQNSLIPPQWMGQGADNASAQGATSSPIVPLSGRGTATLDLVHSHSGACAGVTCTASTCECDVLSGSVTTTRLGKSSLNLNVTSDDTDSFGDGNGSCFPGTGAGTICNAHSCFGIFTTGTICTGIVSQTSTTSEIDLNANETFYIVKSTSTGAFAGSSGGGNLQIIDDVQLVSSSVVSNSGYTSLSGVLQVRP